MKLFTAICLGLLIALSLGNDTVSARDTTVIANTIKVEILPITKAADDKISQRHHIEDLNEAKRTAIASEKLTAPTWVAAIVGSLALLVSALTLLLISLTNRRQLRAYVHVELESVNAIGLTGINALISGTAIGTPIRKEELIVAKVANPPEFLIYAIKIRNYGSTPAHRVYCTSGSLIVDKYPIDDERKLAPPTLGSVIKKDRTFRITGKPISLGPGQEVIYPVTPKEPITGIEKFRVPQHCLYIFGSIYYKDIFNRERRTDFCLTHGIMPGLNALTPQVITAAHGNEAT